MKRVLFAISGLLIFSNLQAVMIDKIKVIGNTYTSTATILYFTGELQNGREYSEMELLSILKRIKERLVNTTWFYDVSTYLTASKEGKDYKNIIIEVTDGFLYRFGGGSIYGFFGKDNINGNGDYMYGSLGWNMQQIQAGKKFLTGSLFLNTSAGNTPFSYYTNLSSGGYDTVYNQNIGGEAEIGYRLNYDLILSLLNSYHYIFAESYSPVGGYYSSGIKAGLDKRVGIFTSPDGYGITCIYQYINPFVKDISAINRFEANASTHLPIIREYGEKNSLYAALKIEAGYQAGQNIPDYLKLSLAGINGIRSLNGPDLIGNSLIESHLELRWDFLHTSIFGIFNIDFEALTFGDAGETINNENLIDNIQYAYGIGLRVFFGMPVYVPLRLEAGWDKKGAFTLFFDTSAPF